MRAGAPGQAAHERGRAPGRNLSAKRKRKQDSPTHLLRVEVIQAIRAKDPAAALAAYDAALAKGMRICIYPARWLSSAPTAGGWGVRGENAGSCQGFRCYALTVIMCVEIVDLCTAVASLS